MQNFIEAALAVAERLHCSPFWWKGHGWDECQQVMESMYDMDKEREQEEKWRKFKEEADAERARLRGWH